MNKLFDNNNPLMKGLSVMASLMAVELLALLCALPVVTAGAAYAAMNDYIIRLVREEEGPLPRSFFRAFSANWKKATALWLLLLAALAFILFDYWAAKVYIPVLRLPVAAVGVLVLTVAFYAFALLTRYENTLRNTLKNAALLAIGYFPRTLGMLLFTAVFWVLGLTAWRVVTPLLVLFGLSLPCYVGMQLMNPMFADLEKIDPPKDGALNNNEEIEP